MENLEIQKNKYSVNIVDVMNFKFIGIDDLETNHRWLLNPAEQLPEEINDEEILKLYNETFTEEVKAKYQEYLESLKPSQEELDKAKQEQEIYEAKLKKQEALANIKVTTSNGNVFDGNEVARSNMVSAIMSADILGITKTTWKLADNSVIEITQDELKEALALSIQEVGKIVIGE